ncbi:MAG: class I SAM-dependent methyltransferase [Fibrobacter sp.]|nr:class I SAM-dependent methyltransferase [Fibrobacter sp.]
MNSKERDFNRDAAQWDTPPRISLAKKIASTIINKNIITKNSDIMDFGCGTGLLTLQLSPLAGSVTAVDSSISMLEILNRKIVGNNITNVRSELKNPEIDQLEGTYDVVVSNMTLHHIKDISSLIRQFYRVIKYNGFLYLADLDLDDGQFHSDNTGVFHFGFDRDELWKFFTEAGFKNISAETATTITKPAGSDQTPRQFTIFLFGGQKV